MGNIFTYGSNKLRTFFLALLFLGGFTPVILLTAQSSAEDSDTLNQARTEGYQVVTYKGKQFDYSIEIPEEGNIRVWESTNSILEDISIFIPNEKEDLDPTEFALAIFDNPKHLDLSSWLEDNSKSTKESIFARFNNIANVKPHENGMITFTHNEMGVYINRVIGLNSSGNIVSFSHNNVDNKLSQEQFITILGSITFEGKSLDKGVTYQDLFSPIVEAEYNSFQETKMLTATSTVSYKLPWSSGTAYVVGQTWGGSTHGCTGLSCYAYDFSISEDTPIKTSAAGVVKLVKGDSQICGGQNRASDANYVVVDHGDSTATLYLHLNSTAVQVGNNLLQGDTVGLSGDTGFTNTGNGCKAHLHFQRQAQSLSWFTQSQSIYFDEYPSLQLAYNSSYTSQNTGIPTPANIIQISGDYVGDSRDDLVFYDPATGRWYIKPTGGGADSNILYRHFANGIPVGGFNFSKNGKDDLVIFNPNEGKWYMKDIATGVERIITFGWLSTMPVAGGDYDNDQINDLALFDKTSGHWYIRPSKGGADWDIHFGWNSTVPVPGGDHDNDKKTDLVLYDQLTGIWYIRRSAGGADWVGIFGWSTALPVGGNDYNGDGWADMTIFDPTSGHWYVRPSGGGPDWDIFFGWSTTVPLGGGTYDNNVATDRTIFDKATGRWYIRPSGGGADWNIPFGWTPGVPI